MLEDDMKRLEELEKEYRAEKRKFSNQVKPVKDEIKLLKADITRQVLAAGKTIIMGDMKAEFVPQVVFHLRKEEA